MRINGRFNQHIYSKYLTRLLGYIEKHFDDGKFYILHDNHRSHTSDLIKDWFNNNIGNYDDFVIPHPR